MSRNIVFEGWLTKSPPTKRIWRTKWRRRWFALRHSGELPGQYFLDYYADRNCRRLKGTINLDLCEQVDAGLHMERSGNGTLDPKLRGSVFTIQTQSRIYHLEADCEAEMQKWVNLICQCCGLRSTEDTPASAVTFKTSGTNTEYYERADSTGPYIPISECITGVKDQNVALKTRSPLGRVSENKGPPLYLSQPQITISNADFSENESTQSEEECKSLNASQSDIENWSATQSFTKLRITSERNGDFENGPPVPPRPPKTFAMSNELLEQEFFKNPRYMDTTENENASNQKQYLDALNRKSHAAPSSPSRPLQAFCVRFIHEEEDNNSPGQLSMQYYNLPSMPPAVDRALKPRPSSHTIIDTISGQTASQTTVHRSDALHYLDLDLHTSTPTSSQHIIHGRSISGGDPDSAYKTVDFLKTEAFNITRQDAEANRSSQL